MANENIKVNTAPAEEELAGSAEDIEAIMKKYALPALREISNDSPYFIEANRLIKFLKWIKDIEDKYVPCNSVLREFIGDSCFYEYNE